MADEIPFREDEIPFREDSERLMNEFQLFVAAIVSGYKKDGGNGVRDKQWRLCVVAVDCGDEDY